MLYKKLSFLKVLSLFLTFSYAFASFEEQETQPKTFSHLADDLVDKVFSFVNDSKTRTSLLLVSRHINHRAKRIRITNNDHFITSSEK